MENKTSLTQQNVKTNMNTQKHTPGPWEHDGDEVYRITSEINSHPICTIDDLNGDDEMEANARLIASAPELLEACKAYVNSEKDSIALLELMEKAIAKAEGN